ncbi:hypothetical protein P170DRAFT_281608 [Aspergillus steynii IBT 23096]|uniref:Uncharacterized protein n=1 Tax=Aspergillus steynii IBT 23096 TaxID=1392250 RepID=A0A2I2FU76_9EURO|nr:uncharacterized protein P170DRAFT_281608 [Aspergillus steynii IBT 23096]PLB44198.1 hypothetical protein P170DRAFT_281608 [Aspergillus steynii IBT 23096]
MSPKRVRKNGSTSQLQHQNPPSPPWSERNVPGDDSPAPVRKANAEAPPGPSTSPRTTEPTAVWDDDEEPADVMGISDQSMGRHPRDPNEFAGTGGYNALKTYKGQFYSGMAVGGSHTWTYEPGTWKETKEEPDLWKIDYRTTKRRVKNAPQGSGAPVGTEYHWFIVGHQKIDANTYETSLSGSKYKLAYKSAGSNSWSVPTVKKQREREIELLDDAKQRVQGLPPVLASERVKTEKHEKGQQKLDSMFGSMGTSSKKRKVDDRGEG